MKTLALISLILLAAALRTDRTLVVHEWGTFTSLQDETGQAIGGINTDDEPVPRFVHDLASMLLVLPRELPGTFFQGAPQCHPDVTMRLETPVLYFHPPKSQTKPLTLDVNVEFRGGWLTQFYPSAEAVAPGVESWPRFGHLRAETTGQLSWPALTVGGYADGPVTADHVWTSPRAVDAASVTTINHESEKFLFYRGVAHIDAPLHVVRDPTHNQLSLHARLDSTLADKQLVINYLWLAEIRPDGSSAFRKLKPMISQNDMTPAAFGEAEFSRQNTALFRADMHHALVKEGLFNDEAEALLNTWELSYFKSPGLRLFFIVPRAWTDQYLPLRISTPAEVQRVMVGRIELVTPTQRELLRKIAAGPSPDMQSFRKAVMEAPSNRGFDGDRFSLVSAGRAPIASLGVPVPDVYQAYLDLGRFRNALVLEEEKRRPTTALRQFIQEWGLTAYQIPIR
jgi:hypothetical protein